MFSMGTIMKRLALPGLAALAALVTGCPQNDYTVELTPHGAVIERKLTFYRQDGANTNGGPNYQTFPSNELAAITALYPRGGVTREGEKHIARAEFGGALPPDIGGAGSYKHFVSSLGTAGVYLERFRGNDDLATQATKRLAAADQLADLALGWSRAEFRHEPRYQNLRHFFDQDFRRDLKNLSLYMWVSYKPEETEELIVRFGQYMVERGYLKVEDAPDLAQIFSDTNSEQACHLLQAFLAEKLGVSPADPMPKSLAFLANAKNWQKSWDKFLSGTDAYRARLRQWEKEKKTAPKAQRPSPSDVADNLFKTLATVDSTGEDGSLTVWLSLASAPDHTNGEWDQICRQVVWKTKTVSTESTARLPAFCYACWTTPDDKFQVDHFGQAFLHGDELLQYCAWHSGLDALQAGEWEKLLSGLQPGAGLINALAAFRFSHTRSQSSTAADFGKNLLKRALEQEP
jgi:hypothetical protein